MGAGGAPDLTMNSLCPRGLLQIHGIVMGVHRTIRP
jgi:hypothetical protein